MRSLIENSIDENISINGRMKDQISLIERIAYEAVETIRRGGKVILFGNGGSAADAQHIAGELVGKFKLEREALPAIALTTNTSIITAISNDIDFEEVFSRQVQGLATSKDLVIGISTSGESANVIKGISAAKNKGAKTIAFTGGDGGRLAKITDISLIVPSKNTPRIQEAHITVGHIICELIEKELFAHE
ncbi:MAG: D-sedoheptulose 7-phosphate isomerase [archaeon]|nr:D-sedoheptulose 7-phosphate isomerase [archaeon]